MAETWIRPLDDRILVKPLPPVQETAGGIVIPDVLAYEAETVGTVIAVGDGPRTPKGVRYDHIVDVGDQILFSPSAGFEIRDAYGDPAILMREQDVLAVFEEHDDA